MNTIKPLKTKFNMKGFNFCLVKREGDKAIYKKFRTENSPSFEVIKIGKHNGYSLGGAFIEPSETYPGDSLWGTKGFTFSSLDKAEQFFTSSKRI